MYFKKTRVRSYLHNPSCLFCQFFGGLSSESGSRFVYLKLRILSDPEALSAGLEFGCSYKLAGRGGGRKGWKERRGKGGKGEKGGKRREGMQNEEQADHKLQVNLKSRAISMQQADLMVQIK